MIGALYAVITIVLMPYTGELRVSEALCLLPFLMPESAMGLFIGCLAANLMTGNIFDIIFGSLATLIAGILTSKMKTKVLACLPPVICNAVIVGAVLAYAYGMGSFWFCAAYVGISEAVAVFALGLPLITILEKKEIFR